MNEILKPDFENLIFIVRGKKVMVDKDLACIYGIQTKALKQQVKRNIKRFPVDFMFETTDEELKELVTNCDRFAKLKHSNVNPMVFTEQGVAMLSSVLHSEEAILVNIEIMRAFARYRALLKETTELKNEIRLLDEKLNNAFNYLLEKIDALHQKQNEPMKPIGYKTKRD